VSIPQSFIQELLARVDVVEIVGRYVPLKKGGANYMGLCPFHGEKSPSFSVSPSKQFFHCFGCGKSGNAIGFLMEHAGMGFVDAVEDLARQVGLTVPDDHTSPADRERAAAARQRQATLSDVLEKAAQDYRKQLRQSPRAVDYLKGRGLSGEVAQRYGLGYAPAGWRHLASVFPEYDDPLLAESGLVILGEDDGKRYDRFRDRVMFPILDQRGNVIGFGGRVIGEGEPKYLNSPETPLFEKGRELYGLPQARKAIQEEDAVLVVEGYMDVVGLVQAGVENVVATLGTAATDANVQKLLKQANRVVFCFDRDSAGDRAAWRAMEVSLGHLADNKTVEILQMPGNQDPDEFIREHGREAFVQQTRSATRLSEFLLRELVKRANPGTAEGRAMLVYEAKPLLQKMTAPILRVQLTKEIAHRAQVSQAEVEAQCGLKPLARSRYAPAQMKQRPMPSSVEYKLLQIVLHKPEWTARLPLELIDRDRVEGEALNAIADAIDHGELPAGGFGMLLEFFRGTPHEALIAAIAENMVEEVDLGALEGVFNDSIVRLRHTALTAEIEELTARARQGLSQEDRQRLAELLAKKRPGAPSTGGSPL